MNSKALYPGTFDPITLGHMDVIDTISKLFSKVYVAILVNPDKKPMFQTEQRVEMIETAVNEYGIGNVKVVASEDLAVNVARKHGATTMIRGVRLNTDFETELFLHFNNQALDGNIANIFIPPKQEHIHVSSTAVRFLLEKGLDLKKYVPRSVIEYLKGEEDNYVVGIS